ncbi:hypothetical protein LTR16_001401 [Cryomyces antarcticus]|uniref:Uncharacterized protein n=1 Tax=Cryomyces antarcticus TaxID=329879 RepID=A0ABR0LSA5_9PEZI|nr:hypothetical protein LTR16_001401 [Cryomyces antarcticus]
MDPFGLAGQHVLVTGASGGIGKVAVKAFLDLQCKVSAQFGSNATSLDDLACDRLFLKGVDVLSEDSVTDFYASAASKFGRVHVLILNHGLFKAEDVSIAEMELAQFQNTIGINLTGSFLFAKHFLRQVSGDSPIPPRVVITGSTAGKYGEQGHADYASSKSALQYGFLLSLKNEIVKHHPHGRANAVAPGWVSTPMATESMKNPETKYKALRTTPMKKIASPEDVVDSLLFLAGRCSGHITGQCVMVEGGMEGRVLNSKEDLA